MRKKLISREELNEMNEIMTNLTLGLVFLLCAVVTFLIWPLDNYLRRKEKKKREKGDKK